MGHGPIVLGTVQTQGGTVPLHQRGPKLMAPLSFPSQGQFGVQEEELLSCLICTVSVTRGEQIQRLHTQQQAEGKRRHQQGGGMRALGGTALPSVAPDWCGMALGPCRPVLWSRSCIAACLHSPCQMGPSPERGLEGLTGLHVHSPVTPAEAWHSCWPGQGHVPAPRPL